MKLVIDTNEMKQNIQKNFEHFNTKLNASLKQSKDKEKNASIEKLEDEIAYAKMMIDWNEERIKEGKTIFNPLNVSKSVQRLITDGLVKLEINLKEKEDKL